LSSFNTDGINTVITLCPEAVSSRDRRINYLHFPLSDCRPIPTGKFDAILDAIAENIRWGKVLLHCSAGMSRSPVMAASWMHAVGYKTFYAALEEIAGLRPIIDPSPALLKSAKEHLR
jgi:protein-tyrosine phosphatase